MKKRSIFAHLLTLATCFSAMAIPVPLGAEGLSGAVIPPLIVRPSEIEWTDTVEFPGLKVAVVYGDPSKPGPYVMYAKFKPGFMTKPHYHTADRFVTVNSGIWWATVGSKESPTATTPLNAGTFMLHTTGLVHFDGAKETGTVVQIMGIGPVSTVYVDDQE